MKHLWVLTSFCALLGSGGCGDANNTTASTVSTAEGLWNGSTNSNRTTTTAVLDDGTMYMFYSAQGNAASVAGVLQGSSVSNVGSFSSSNTKDFRIGASVLDATIAGNYTARQSLNGTIAYSAGGTVTFTSAYNASYDTQPSLASLAGVYQGQASSSGGSQGATVTVASDGSFQGSEQNNCAFTGKVTLRARGNVLDLTTTFGGFPCFFGNATFQGVAYRDVATNRLYTAAPNSARTDAAIFFGTRIF